MLCFDGVSVEPEALEPITVNLSKLRFYSLSKFNAHRIGHFSLKWC